MVAEKMIMSIIHPEDAQDLTKQLTQAGFRVTQAATQGGFLRRGNVTLMIGVQENDVQRVMEIIGENTHLRSRGGWWLRPGAHKEGAIAFVVDMEQAKLPD